MKASFSQWEAFSCLPGLMMFYPIISHNYITTAWSGKARHLHLTQFMFTLLKVCQRNSLILPHHLLII